MSPEFKRSVVGAKIRLRARGPFFSVLLDHLRLGVLEDGAGPCDTACTDGRVLLINEKYWNRLTSAKKEFLLAHEVLHAALGHPWRHGGRQLLRWNFACDYVVNLICREAGFEVDPKDCLIDDRFIEMTVDEVYALLPEELVVTIAVPGTGLDIVATSAGNLGECEADSRSRLESTWKAALAAADIAERMYGRGNSPLGQRIKVVLEDGILDWCSALWRVLSFDGADFTAWDRRLIHDEMFVEDLGEAERPAKPAVFVDTSGSTIRILGRFIGEVKSLASLYSTDIDVYFEDVTLIGPIPLSEVDEPIGGGGTSFCEAFKKVSKEGYTHVVYLTDLDGEFPEELPEAEVLWVVPAGTTVVPPFGKVVKLLEG